MGTLRIFGIPVTVDFSGDLIEKRARYEDLCEQTSDDEMDNDIYEPLAKERIELFYELRENGVDTGGEEGDGEEPERKGFFSRMFGF